MRKLILAIGVLICLGIAGERLYKFISEQSTKPLAKVGECIVIPAEEMGDILCEVMELKDKISLLKCDMLGIAEVELWADNQKLREEGARKVKCE